MEDLLENNEFLSAYFEGNLAGKEKEEFERWLEQNPSAQSKLDSYRLIWESSSKLLDKGGAFERRWTKLSDEIKKSDFEEHDEYPEGAKSRGLGLYTKIAASILIGLTALVGIRDFSKIEVVVPQAETEKINLPDGSLVTLNAASLLSYNRASWWLGYREVDLDGEAFFEIKKAENTFSVTTDLTTTTVLGTSFNIFARERLHVVTCYTGKVKVENNENFSQYLVLSKGEELKLDVKNSDFQSMLPSQIDNTVDRPHWIEGKFHYERSPIRDVLDEIERQYDLKILSDQRIDTLLFTGYIDKHSIDDALNVLSLSVGVSWEMEDADQYRMK